MSSVIFSATMALALGNNITDCQCPVTSSNRAGCCSDGGSGGEGSGDFCGNWLQKTHCNGDTPVCCNSDISASCGPVGSSCSPGCILGYKGLGSKCRVIAPPAPSPASKAFDLPRARAIGALAAAAGCGPTAAFRSFSCKQCRDVGFDIVPGTMRFLTHDDLHTHNATFTYVARLQGVGNAADADFGCVVGNKGSTVLVNYVQDAEFWRQKPDNVEDCDGCEVHTGFKHAWTDLEDDAIKALAEIGCAPDGASKKVLVTGHSLGAAASIVAMFNLQDKGFDVQPSVVFELPRVGNAAFSEAFAKRFDEDFPVFVVTHAMDPVVHLPWTNLPGFDYRHVNAPEVYYFPSDNIEDFIVCDGPEDPLCSSRYALPDTITSGDDHCKNIPLSPIMDDQGLPNFCISPADFCSGGLSSVIV